MNAFARAAAIAALVVLAVPVHAQQPPAPLASQESNWSGVTVSVTEFKRKGNTLTAKLRLQNASGAKSTVDIHYNKVYVLDAAAGKKYEPLKDEQGMYIAALSSGQHERFWEDIPAGQSKLIWVKFPAPPATTKSATLQIESVAPFEDLPIQDQ